MLFLVGNNKGNAHKKQKYTQKKCENANVVHLKKNASAVPFEKEQQNAEVLFHFKKEQQNVKKEQQT